MHAFSVFIKFCAATASTHMRDLGYLFDQHFRLLRERGGFCQGHARIQTHSDQQRALVKRRQKGCGEERYRCRRGKNGRRTRCQRCARVREHTAQCAAVASFEPHQKFSVAVIQRFHVRKQVVRKHGCNGDRNREGRERCYDEGHTERHKQSPLDTGQCKQRNENQHDDNGGVQDGRAHFERCSHH